MTAIRVPPGRAGRLWLRNRLDTAEHGVSLLDQKLRALRAEQDRVSLRADYLEAEWTDRARAARTWLLRAALIGGQRGIRLAGDSEPAAVEVVWTTVMGVRYPSDATCTSPEPAPDSPSLPGSAAVVRAAAAHRSALDAAVRLAALLAARRVIATEIAVTRQRIRSLRHHWIPRLTGELAWVELELAEQERAEGVRHRWASGKRSLRSEPSNAAPAPRNEAAGVSELASEPFNTLRRRACEATEPAGTELARCWCEASS